MATSSTSTTTAASATATSALPAIAPVPLDFSKAANPLWLVKVPKYLAKKWSEASDNSQVGKIIITQTKGQNKTKPQIVFQLNEALGQNVQMKLGENKFIEHKIPLEHKFLMTPIANQNVYILKQSAPEEVKESKESLSIMGKVIQRAECTPAQNDSSYMSLKRETNKQFNEPKNFIKIVDDRLQRTKFMPKLAQQFDRNRDKGPQKRLRADRDKVQDALFAAFTKHQYYTMRDLEKITKQPPSYLKDILHEICRHNAKGPHKNTWELKEEYRQTNSAVEAKKPDGAKSGSGAGADVDNMDEDDDEEDDDFEDLDDDDDMISQM